MNRFTRVIALAIMIPAGAALFLTYNCSNKDPVTSNDSPALPPQSSFIMAFDDFSSSHSPGKPLEALTTFNWGYSAISIAVWNTILAVTLAVPVGAFVESFNHQPVLQSDGSWQWTYNFLGGTVYTARLNGKIAGSKVDWKMYVSKLNEYSDFLWYYGSSEIAGTSGTWTLNQSPNDLSPIPFLQIEWHRNIHDSTGDLKYTNIVPNGIENGGYISFRVTKDQPYNRFYKIYNKGLGNTTEIEWDFGTKVGRVKDELHYGNDVWRCWDTALQDMVCPLAY